MLLPLIKPEDMELINKQTYLLTMVLDNGDTLVSSVFNYSQSHFLLIHPAIVDIFEDNGVMKYTLHPINIASDDMPCLLALNKVVYAHKVNEEFEGHYKKYLYQKAIETINEVKDELDKEDSDNVVAISKYH